MHIFQQIQLHNILYLLLVKYVIIYNEFFDLLIFSLSSISARQYNYVLCKHIMLGVKKNVFFDTYNNCAKIMQKIRLLFGSSVLIQHKILPKNLPYKYLSYNIIIARAVCKGINNVRALKIHNISEICWITDTPRCSRC